MKLKQLHPAQIPPETKYEVVNVVCHKKEARPPPPPHLPALPKDIGRDEQRRTIPGNDVNTSGEAGFQPNNNSPASPTLKQQA